MGRILDALDRRGVLENTLILFTADHGELLGDFGCFGKRSFHDASQKIPMIIRWPERFPADTICTEPASLVDLLPTFLSAAEVPLAEDTDGKDMAELANGGERGEPVYFHYGHGENAILGAMDREWKYAWSAPDQKEFLFPTSDFPEKRNHASDVTASKPLERLGVAVRQRASCFNFSKATLEDSGCWRKYPARSMPEDPDEGLLYQDTVWAKPELPAEYPLDYPRENFLGY